MGTYIKTFVERSTKDGWVYEDLSAKSWESTWQQYSSFAVLDGTRDRDSVCERFSVDSYLESELPLELEEEWLEGVSRPISSLEWTSMRDFPWEQEVSTEYWIQGQGNVSTKETIREYASDLYDTYKFMGRLESPEELRLIYWYG